MNERRGERSWQTTERARVLGAVMAMLAASSAEASTFFTTTEANVVLSRCGCLGPGLGVSQVVEARFAFEHFDLGPEVVFGVDWMRITYLPDSMYPTRRYLDVWYLPRVGARLGFPWSTPWSIFGRFGLLNSPAPNRTESSLIFELGATVDHRVSDRVSIGAHASVSIFSLFLSGGDVESPFFPLFSLGAHVGIALDR